MSRSVVLPPMMQAAKASFKKLVKAFGGRTARAAAGAPIIVFLLGLLYIVSYLDRLILALLVAPVRAEFGISDTAIALLVGPVFALFGGLFALPMGWLVDRANRTRLIPKIGRAHV